MLQKLIFTLLLLSFSVWASAQDSEMAKRRDLAVEIFDLTGAEQVMEQLISQSGNSVRIMLQSRNQGKTLPPEIIEKFEKFSKRLAENFRVALTRPEIKNELFGPIFQSYAELFTVDELQQMLNFYKTPLARKFINEQLRVLPRLGPQIQQSVGKVLTPILEATAKEVGL
jgi:hypothetical protein